jgi:hypothetical protein
VGKISSASNALLNLPFWDDRGLAFLWHHADKVGAARV